MWNLRKFWPGLKRESSNPIMDMIKSLDEPFARYNSENLKFDSVKIRVQSIHQDRVCGHTELVSGDFVDQIPFVATMVEDVNAQKQGVFCEAVNDGDSFWVLGAHSADKIIHHLHKRFDIAYAEAGYEDPIFDGFFEVFEIKF